MLAHGSLGNHELDEAVSGLIPFISNLTTPVLAANLILDHVSELKNVKNLYRSTVIVKNGIRIGIIGYLTAETKFLAPRNEIEYEDEVLAIKREANILKAQGVNILIALGHSGFIKDLEIAKKVEDIDLVIGGHSNTFLWNQPYTEEKPEVPEGLYPVIVQQEYGRKVPVVQAYAYTKYIGRLHIIFDQNGEIKEIDGNPILLNKKIPRDPDVLKIVDKYRDSVYKITNEVVGVSEISLNGNCRLRECNIGDFITDAILNYTKEYYSDLFPDVYIAVVQGGRIRASIDQEKKPFNVTRGDWITVLPFADTLVVVTMNGSILLKALEHSVSKWRVIDSAGQFLQLSGIVVSYDLSREPGNKVLLAKAKCSNCNNPNLEIIQADLEYKLIMPAFIANGGDDFVIFENLPKEILPYDEVTCILDYVSKYSPIKPKLSKRISIINEPIGELPSFYRNAASELHKDTTELCLFLVKLTYFLVLLIN